MLACLIASRLSANLFVAADAFANTERSKNGFFFSDVLCELGTTGSM